MVEAVLKIIRGVPFLEVFWKIKIMDIHPGCGLCLFNQDSNYRLTAVNLALHYVTKVSFQSMPKKAFLNNAVALTRQD